MSTQIKRIEQKFYNMCATSEKDANKVSTLFTSIQNAIKESDSVPWENMVPGWKFSYENTDESDIDDVTHWLLGFHIKVTFHMKI